MRSDCILHLNFLSEFAIEADKDFDTTDRGNECSLPESLDPVRVFRCRLFDMQFVVVQC